ncbi:hypothetical protein LWI28_024596 [Acer negundo]|uniref:Uncharacterized protein n=1 Tax=Acer negundo TaxID=4023 RepID=A0AAD5NH44_ACENE|nr:hypothetical protein LWI28_024596 [Acer negundo]KAK4835799.1 hypothetical protein QYF36_014744 [Acer negundo]
MVAESWFRNWWRIPRKHEAGPQKEVIAVLAFEVASLMTKLVHLWQSLSDKQVARLREEIKNSVGIQKLVSEDDEFIANLICREAIENLTHVAKSVARLAKKCNDPGLKSFESTFDELLNIGSDPYGWEFVWKKMEKKVKKMERFISINATLYQEMEMLSDHTQTLKRMKANNGDFENLLEFQKKVAWKQQEVKNLREISLWNKTYDYTVLLLARSIFTLFGRIQHVFGINLSVEVEDSRDLNSDFIYRSQSVSALLQSSVHPSENTSIPRFSSGPLGRFTAYSGPMSKPKRANNYHSGPLSAAITKSGPISGKSNDVNFFSGPLAKSSTKSGSIFGKDKTSKKSWLSRDKLSALNGKKPPLKANRLTQVGPFKGCMTATDSSPVANRYSSPNIVNSGVLNGAKNSSVHTKSSIFSSKRRLLDAPPETLGAAALALHYANVIIVIEKLVASPHLIGHDARDDLYNMLPASVRAALRDRLKQYTKSLASSVYDTVLAGEWTVAMTSILEWLAPLAHSMIRWQSERSFEQQSLVSRTNVLLVQTLYFANQEKTEATITELLVGLNYVWRFGREANARALLECASSRMFDECLDLED